MNQRWNANIVGIPYRGGGPIAQALVANELQIAKMGLGNFLGLISTGKIKPIAVAAARRSKLAPDVPTLAEAGIDFPPFGWWGLAGPKGLPQPIVDKLNAEFVKLYREPKFVDYLEQQAVLPGLGHARGVRRIPQEGPQGRRVPDQDRGQAARGLQAGAVIQRPRGPRRAAAWNYATAFPDDASK